MNATRVLTAFCLAVVGVSAQPAIAQTQGGDWAKVEAAAKAEGKVVVYNGLIGNPELGKIIKLFQDKYRVPVELLEARPSEIQERVRTEVATKRPIGDVLLIGETTQALIPDLLQPCCDFPNVANLVIKPAAEKEVPAFLLTYAMLVNTDLVPAGAEPRSWKDLLDPRWKGKILSSEMDVAGAGHTMFGVMQDAFGTDFHRKLAKQDITFNLVQNESERRTGRGEFAIFIPFYPANLKNLQGMPVKFIVPEEGLPYVPMSLAPIVGAPHPNAGRLFMNFFLSREAQLVMANGGFPPVIGGLENEVSESMRPLVNNKLMGRQKMDGQEERMIEARQIYKGRN